MLTPRENLIHYLTGKPGQWTPCTQDMLPFMPQMMPDNVARAFVIQQKPYTGTFGGTDLFGCLWEYEPQVGGSMEKGVLMEDICDWETKSLLAARLKEPYCSTANIYSNCEIFTSRSSAYPVSDYSYPKYSMDNLGCQELG